MVNFSGPPSAAIRNKPISLELKKVLEVAALTSGVSSIVITSGGQDTLGEGTRRIGSTRHDLGRAADIQCKIGDRTLKFTNEQADPELIAFITAAAAAGANGIGAATDYMGPRTIHIGFGLSPSDHSKLTWGKNGNSVNAPDWLRGACDVGWNNNTQIVNYESKHMSPGRYIVVARNGLRLRNGPGANYDAESVLPLGTTINLISLDKNDPNWGRIDLENDGLVDGYVHCGFIAPSNESYVNEYVLEPSKESST